MNNVGSVFINRKIRSAIIAHTNCFTKELRRINIREKGLVTMVLSLEDDDLHLITPELVMKLFVWKTVQI